MIQLKQITLKRAHKTLLEKADLTLYAGQKVGLIGKNGSGKTSLLMMLRNELAPEDGEFSFPKQLRLAYIRQEIPQTTQSAQNYAAFGDTTYEALSQAIEHAEAANDGMRLGELHMKMAEIGGYTIPSKAAKILHGLGFSSQDLEKPIQAFSGGWQMRLNLARLLMDRADILLLDEPTNHLDLEAIVWLEQWLRHSKQTIVLISHDRDFLDRVSTHIAHLENHQLKLYTGNYSQFEKQRAQALMLQQAAFKKQEAKRKHLQSFVDRFRAKATKAKQAQSRMKMLARMEDILPVQEENPFRFEFKETKSAGNPMLTIENVNVGYENNIILNKVNFSLRDGDRIGLLGKNGAGKSTLIKLINNELPAKGGEIHRSTKINIGYFAQHQLALLNPKANALNHLQDLDKTISESQARKYLGGFNFSNDDVFRATGTFSGGEKSRLVLALIIWQQPNLLLLDEPTNHLDLEMREALNLALQSYTGAVVLVSHDRHLLNCTCDEFWLVAQGKVTPYANDLAEYQQTLIETESNKTDVKKNKSKTNLKPAKNQAEKIKKLEALLPSLEEKLIRLDEKLNDNALYSPENKETLNKLTEEREQIIKELEQTENVLLTLYENSN